MTDSDPSRLAWLAVGGWKPEIEDVVSQILGFTPPAFSAQAISSIPNKSIASVGLFVSTSVATDELMEALQVLSEHEIPFGLFPCTSAPAIRAWLEKSLTWPGIAARHIPVRPDRVVVCAPTPLAIGSSAPPAPTAYVDSFTPGLSQLAQRLAMNADFLVLAGHSNQVDGGFGTHLIACSRQPASPDDSGKNFPCHYDSRCFRQKDYGRAATSMEGLVDVASIKARLVVITGCNMIAARATWFTPSATLIDRISRSSAASMIATFGTTSHSVGADLMLFASLAEGHTLAAACTRTNNFLRTENQPTGMPKGLGPLCVVGNPDIEVSGLPLLRRTIAANTSSVEFDLEDVELLTDLGFFAIVDGICDAGAGRRFYADSDVGVWVRGIRRPEGGLYLWIFPKSRCPQTLRIDFELHGGQEPDSEEWAVEAAACDDWSEILSTTAGYAGKKGGPVDSLLRTCTLHEALRDEIRAYIPKARALESLPLVVNRVADSDAQRLESDLKQLDEIRVAILADGINWIGTRLSHLWTSEWRSIEVDEATDMRCSCGGTLRTTIYGSLFNELKREVASCPACGPVMEGPIFESTENGQARALTAMILGEYEGSNAQIRWKIQNLHMKKGGFAVAVLQDVNCDQVILSERSYLSPRMEAILQLNLPPKLTPGAYPVAVLASFGGRLSIRRDMVKVAPPASPQPVQLFSNRPS